MYVSIDLVEEIIERQIRRYKKKLIDKKQAAIAFSQAFIEDEEDTSYEDDIQIVKTKKFAMKPVNPDVRTQLLRIPKLRDRAGKRSVQA